MTRPVLARDRAVISVTGGAPERVLSACAAQGIQLRRVSPVENYSLNATVSAFQVGKIRKIAAKYQCEVELVRLSRLGRFARRVRRRKLLALLLALACAAAWLSSLFVWEIRVDGNETVSAARILRALDDCGVTYGTWWPGMNIDLVRSGVQLRVPELEWFTVNLRGSVAQVHVRERVEAPPVVENDTPADLCAAHSGVIVRMSVLQGQPVVQRGDFVVAGQTLVTGMPEDLQGTSRGVYALGSVRARAAWCLTASAPLSARRAQPSGKGRTRWALLVGKKRMNFGKSSSIPAVLCDKIYSVYVCAIPGLFRLPVSLLRETVTPLTCAETALDAEDVRARLERTLLDTLQSRIGPDGEVISQRFSCAEHDGMLTVTLHCECEQEIAFTQPYAIPPTEEGSST